MGIKEMVISIMADTLRRETRAGIASGKLKCPLNVAATAQATWDGILSNDQTSMAAELMGITKSDVDKMVAKVYKELECT